MAARRSLIFGLCRAAAALAVLAAIAVPAHADEQSLLTVDRAVLADGVDSASRHFLHEVASPVTRRRLSLWMELRGTPELLEKLKAANGKLVIHHVWRKYVFTGVETRLDQPLLVGRDGDIERLAAQVATDGFFTWHTWSNKVHLSPGNWRVDLEYDDHEPVMCHTDGEEPHACFYPFEVE